MQLRKSEKYRLDPFKWGDWINYIFLGLTALVCLLPVVNVIALSFSNAAAADGGMVSFWPVRFTLASYEHILEDKIFFRSILVSFMRVVVGTSLSLILLFLMSYPMSLEKEEFRARNIYMWYILITMLFNGGLIPTYMVVTQLKLTDTMWALTLPYLIYAFNVVLMMNYFRNLPKELKEAASIDGAGPMAILFKVFVPLSKPVTATITLFCILYFWNDYLAGMIYINKVENYPLMTYIRSLTLTQDIDSLTSEEMIKRAEIGSLTYNSAKIVIAMLPIMVIYPFLQKYFVTGITLGSVKG